MDVVDGITECEFDHVLEANYVGDVVPDPAEASEVAWMAFARGGSGPCHVCRESPPHAATPTRVRQTEGRPARW